MALLGALGLPEHVVNGGGRNGSGKNVHGALAGELASGGRCRMVNGIATSKVIVDEVVLLQYPMGWSRCCFCCQIAADFLN